MIILSRLSVGLLIVALLLIASVVSAHDYLPGEMPDHPILLKGGRLYTISNGIMADADLLIEAGRISQIGVNLSPPEGSDVINLNGQNLYPGLIAASSSLGLVEIGAVRATRDSREIGRINPNIKARIAYNPDSEIIPSVRSNGVTNALIIPGGSLVAGVSSLMNLDGWTYESCTEKESVGMHISWPRVSVRTGWRVVKSAEEQKKEMAENRRLIHELFADAQTYYNARKAGRSFDPDSRWEAMIPVLDGTLPLFINANDYRQIKQAVSFVNEHGLKMILVGGKDAWMLPELLIENEIPVILGSTQSSSPRQDDPHDLTYQLPGRLEEAGVQFCISTGGASGVRNLNLQASQAVPYGLSPEMALRSITLSAAEILGVADDLGSLEVGKRATLVVSEGDILDLLTHRITHMFINGRPVDLNNKHKELFEKYSAKRSK